MPTIGCGHWNGRRNRLPHLVDQSFGEVGGAGGFACRWKLISIAHPNPENGYAPAYGVSQQSENLRFQQSRKVRLIARSHTVEESRRHLAIVLLALKASPRSGSRIGNREGSKQALLRPDVSPRFHAMRAAGAAHPSRQPPRANRAS